MAKGRAKVCGKVRAAAAKAKGQGPAEDRARVEDKAPAEGKAPAEDKAPAKGKAPVTVLPARNIWSCKGH